MPVEPAELDSLTLAPTSIGSQNTAQGTVTLTREAPSDGAVVALASSVVDAARTPASVTVPAGSKSATFAAASPTVGMTMTTIISATYRNITRTATLTVNPPALEADFHFASSPSSDTCEIVDVFGRLARYCIFDARTSRGFPRVYHWTLQHAGKTITRSEQTPVLEQPPTDCSFLSGGVLNAFKEFTIRVDLQVEGVGGVRSGNATKLLKIRPYGYCGYF